MRATSVIGLGLAAVLIAATPPVAFAPAHADCRVSDAFEIDVQTRVTPPVVFPGGFGNGDFSIGPDSEPGEVAEQDARRQAW